MAGRESLITTLEEAPDKIAELLLRPEAAGAPGEAWNRVDVFRHIQSSDAILGHRIMQILVRTDPPLPAFDDRVWGDFLAKAGVRIDEQLSGFRLGRNQLVGVLRSLSESDWLRSGIHEVHGRQTIDQVVKHMADHETEHLEQLISLTLDG